MKEDSQNTYMDEIGRSPLLSETDERLLSVRVRAGDERALNKLVESNLRLVVSLARTYQGKELGMDDLVSEGNLGLIKAASKFDGERGIRFASYAAIFVRRSIERALKIESSERRVESRRDGNTRSVDAPLGAKPNVSLLSVLIDGNSPFADERTYSHATESAVERALQCLGSREKQVIAAYFGIDRERETMMEIAEDMGLQRERVRQIRNRAIRRLRKAYRFQLKELF